MDTSNWRPSQGASGPVGDSSMESGDWRAQLQPDSRQRIVNKIMDTLKKHLPFSGHEGIHELKKIAMRFEEKIYTAATSQPDYLRKISMKMLTMENRSPNPMPDAMQSNSAANSVNPSDPGSQMMQQVNNQGQQLPIPVPSNHTPAGQHMISQSMHNNIGSTVMQGSSNLSSALPPGSGLQQSTMANTVQQNSVGNTMGPTNFTNQRQIPVRQQLAPPPQQQSQNSHYLYQQQLHQIAKQNLLQPDQLQPSQQSVMQPTMMQPSSLSTSVQNQQSVVVPQSSQPLMNHQQSVMRQQREQQVQPTQQHLLGQHNNLSNMPHQQSGNASMQTNQQLQHMLQSKMPIQQQNLQSQSQPQLQQQVMPHMQSQSGQLQQPNMQQRLPTSGGFQQQSVVDQQRQLFQQPRAMPDASSTSLDSIAQTGNVNGGDWQEEVYQKIKTMKDLYLLDLNDMHQKILGKLQQYDSLPQQSKNEQLEKLKVFKNMLERFMAFLQIPKQSILANYKDKLSTYEKQIVNVINSNRRKPAASQQLPPPHQQSQQTHSQLAQLQSLDNNQINLQNLQQNTTPSLSGGSNGQQVPHQQQIKQQEQLLQSEQLKQFQQRQMQQSFLHKQLMQQQQFHQQTKQQQRQSVQLQGNQQPQINQMNNDVGDVKPRQQIGVKSGGFQQNQGQRSVYNQQLKPGGPFSPQIDQSNVFKSANSPFTVPSPSTPSASPIPGEFERTGGVLSVSNNAGNIGHQQQQSGAVLPTQSIGTPGISASPLLAELTSQDGNHGAVASIGSGKSTVAEQPLERLLKVVKSISPTALSSSVDDIGSVVSIMDRYAGSAPGNGSRAAVGEDLVAMTKCRLQSRNFVTQDGNRKMKRFTTAIPLNVVSSDGTIIESSNQLNVDSTVSSAIKRPRVERKHALLDEIKEINRRLIDTVVDISEEDVDPAAAASDGGDGTMVKCSYSAVALGPNLKSQYASPQMSPIQPLRLFVPANYPNCSPVLLDKFPAEVSKENEDLSTKTKSRFSISLRSLSQPMSLKEIAKTWDVCARAVMSEYAQQSGGGTFSSKYGTWENCKSAA